MVFTLITDATEIRDLQNRLEKEIKRESNNDRFPIIYKGKPEEAYYIKAQDIYWRPKGASKHERYRNSFGHGKPTLAGYQFQINFPVEGVDRKIEGAFVRSHDGAVCVLHRGRARRHNQQYNLDEFLPELITPFIDDYDKKGKPINKSGILIPFLDASSNFEPDFLPVIKRIVDELASMDTR